MEVFHFTKEVSKGVTIEMDIYSQIRFMTEAGVSQREIAKQLGISRQTVKKYCEGNTLG